jgi:hypothetical protein
LKKLLLVLLEVIKLAVVVLCEPVLRTENVCAFAGNLD